MIKVVYLIGAGASYGKRGKSSNTGEILPGRIERGLPVVNQLEPALDYYCRSIQKNGPYGYLVDDSDYSILYKELKWLRDKCHTYPTIDTYAKKLFVTGQVEELNRLKNALSSFFVLIQSHEKRDLRYDGLVAAIIQDDGSLPNSVSVFSWNYDYQLEYVLRDFSSEQIGFGDIWQKNKITCKGFKPNVDINTFNCVKLNGTAMFSTSDGELLSPDTCDESTIEGWYENGFQNRKSCISFAWEKNDIFLHDVLPLAKKAKTLVVIGYSFPYVNRLIDRTLIQSMDELQNVYIQDIAANDVMQSFETLFSGTQQIRVSQRTIHIHPITSVSQFIIPHELA